MAAPTNSNLTMTPYAWGMLVTLSIVWGGTFFFQEIAVQELPVFTIVSIRVLIAALLLWAVTALTGNTLPSDAKIWARPVPAGVGQQRHPVHPDRMGPTGNLFRSRGYPERHSTAVHGPYRPFRHDRRKTDAR